MKYKQIIDRFFVGWETLCELLSIFQLKIAKYCLMTHSKVFYVNKKGVAREGGGAMSRILRTAFPSSNMWSEEKSPSNFKSLHQITTLSIVFTLAKIFCECWSLFVSFQNSRWSSYWFPMLELQFRDCTAYLPRFVNNYYAVSEVNSVCIIFFCLS